MNGQATTDDLLVTLNAIHEAIQELIKETRDGNRKTEEVAQKVNELQTTILAARD
jgi:hypothetical protein